MPDCVEGYYIPTGVGISIANAKHIKYAYFCIAWVELKSDDHKTNGDIYTWYAADPL
jgi:hypothetical protein